MSGRHRRICTACGTRFFIIGKKADQFDRCDSCVRHRTPPRAPIEELVEEFPTEPVKPLEPTLTMKDYNGRETTADQLKIRLMRGW